MKGWKSQKPTKLDGNDTTTLSHHPYILYHFATMHLHKYALSLFSCVQRRVVEGSWVGSGGCVVHFDVHGE